MESQYRPCVLVVFTKAAANGALQVLVAERADHAGAWQFPQGGVEMGETPDAAIFREGAEELGTREFVVTHKAPRTVRYEFPAGMQHAIAKAWRGQEQTWFQARFVAGAEPQLTLASDREFVRTEWVSVEASLTRVVEFKRECYGEGLRLLGLL